MTTPHTQTSTALRSRAQLLGAMSGRIHDPRMSTGALASLRRGSRHDVARQAAFHAAVADIPSESLALGVLVRWAAVAQCMAVTGVPATSALRDGSGMAQAGLSESRFARLLASHGDGFFDQLLLVARFLHAKDTAISWQELGELALTDDLHEERADVVRLALARDYYRELVNGIAT